MTKDNNNEVKKRHMGTTSILSIQSIHFIKKYFYIKILHFTKFYFDNKYYDNILKWG